MPKKRRPKIQRRQATTSSIKGHQGAKQYLGVKGTRLPRSWAAKEAHRSTLFKVASQLSVPVFDYPSRSPRVYKNSKELQKRIASGLISPLRNSLSKSDSSTSPREFPPATSREYDPLRIPPHHPHTSRQPPWRDPLGPFAVGGEDLDPFRGQRGGMILDPLRTGFPRALIDPSSGLPNRLPPGAVPPGARFDPFGPIGTSPSGPSPDHLPPPGYDDMFM